VSAEPRREAAGRVEAGRAVGRDVELITSDDVRLRARRWDATGTCRATVVLVHGFAASLDEEKLVALVEALGGAGFDGIAYDGRGHGGSGGETTLGDRERWDVAAAVTAIGASAAPVVLVGASMGAIAALRFAASSPGSVAGVVAVSCPAWWRLPFNARGVLSTLLTQTPFGREFARRQMGVRIARPAPRPVPPIDLVGELGVPVAIVHGRADPFISVAAAEALFATAHEPRRLELVEGFGHAFEPEATPAILGALEWCLEPTNASPTPGPAAGSAA
jgi:alpha-beta hydrolase superfamily lysophospholipase